jgi:hypothetical protein
MSESTIEWLVATGWIALITIFALTGAAILLGLIAVIRKSPYGSRAGRIVISLVLSVIMFPPATLVFEQVAAHTVAYRVHVGDPGFAVAWDVMLIVGSSAIALAIGWLMARILGGAPPIGWARSERRIRDTGLIALMATAVVILLLSRTGPIPRSLEPLDLNLWGIWALAEAVPLAVLAARRFREGDSPVETAEAPWLDLSSRRFLAGYYWIVAVAVSYAQWSLSRVMEALQD